MLYYDCLLQFDINAVYALLWLKFGVPSILITEFSDVNYTMR